MKKIKVVEYSPRDESIWNNFITGSKNGTFLFFRNFMEYHSERFDDASLLFFSGNSLIAVLPANIQKGVLYSHAGLTYGGVVSDYRMKTPVMLEIFKELKAYLKTKGIQKIVYKAMPPIYHIIPAEEDLYALFRNDARMIKREASSAITCKEKVRIAVGKRQRIKKLQDEGLKVRQNTDFKAFMNLVKNILKKKFGKEPTHSTEEIELLAGRFPNNIKLFSVDRGGDMLAGVIVYESNKNVVHTQYIANSDEGKKIGAADFILDFLIKQYAKEYVYFDFGISTEKGGTYLNEGLITQKEEFGASTVMYDTYELDI